MTELLKLAERCEREEPSRELDARIQAAAFPDWVCKRFAYYDDYDERPWSKIIDTITPSGPSIAGYAENRMILAFTTSLDAAVTLVPEGAEYSISTLYGLASVEMPLNSSAGWESARRTDGNVPMTICAAALRARAAMVKA